MTVQEWNDKLHHYEREYSYYNWAANQPHASEEQRKEDCAKRDEYFEKSERMKTFINNVIENTIKTIDKDVF